MFGLVFTPIDKVEEFAEILESALLRAFSEHEDEKVNAAVE